MSEINHVPCLFCGSSDAFGYNTETGQFYCFSCEAKPSTKGGLCYDGETLQPFNQKQEEEGLSLEPYLPDVYRGIPKNILEKFGVYFTKYNGKETVHYAYPHATKHRELPKNITVSGKLDAFYGQDDYSGGKVLTITEGEEDRLSVITMMGDYPCVSVPGSTPSREFWENARDYLSGFEKIVLSVDNDAPGNKLAESFFRMFPGKVYRVLHNKFKDANEFLTEKAAGEYQKAWWNAQKIKPSNLLCTPEDFLKLYEETPSYEYFETGIPELDEKMLGIHKGAFTIVLAETGIGKTEFFRYLENQGLKTTNYTFGICHGEETQLRSLLGLVSYDIDENVTRRDLIEEKGLDEEVKKSIKSISEDERLYQFKIRVDEGVDEIVEQVRFLATAMGVDFIFIEPLQDFVSASNTTEKESLLTDLTNKLKRLAPELDIGIVAIAHANKDGEAKYAASIVQGAAYEIRLERDMDSEDEQEKDKTYIYVGRKNRTGGGSGPAGCLVFNRDSYTLTPDILSTMDYNQPKTERIGF